MTATEPESVTSTDISGASGARRVEDLTRWVRDDAEFAGRSRRRASEDGVEPSRSRGEQCPISGCS